MKGNHKRTRLLGVWTRFSRSKTAMLGLAVLCIFILLAAFAPLIAPYGYDEQNLREAYQGISMRHLLGTDNLGRDTLSRLIWGSRISLVVGLLAVAIGAAVGGLLGSFAAFYGGRIDSVLMRVVDIMMAIPSMVLAIAICAALGPGLVNTMIAVGFSSVPTYARVVRSAVLTIRQQEYIEAAGAIGSGNWRTIAKHIIPNSLAPIIVQASLGVGNAIQSAASMSFLGLGIQPPTPEWGAMLSTGRQFIRDYPMMVVAPGICIMLVISSLNLLGDGLRDALDPRMKR
ncbi:ABC transporter permease [Lachnospiraceae bacterium 45-P1]